MLERLKRETAQIHQDIEKENLARFIIDHSIELFEYKKLLLQNFTAYNLTEKEISTFLPSFRGDKHLEIAKDLENLGLAATIPENLCFNISAPAEAYGAAYVVLGSGLGGMVISKHIEKCKNLKDIHDPVFFSINSRNIEDWKNFQKEIEKISFSEEEQEMAIRKAKETFSFFAKIFKINSFHPQAQL